MARKTGSKDNILRGDCVGIAWGLGNFYRGGTLPKRVPLTEADFRANAGVIEFLKQRFRRHKEDG